MSGDDLQIDEQRVVEEALTEARALFPSFDATNEVDAALTERLVDASLEYMPSPALPGPNATAGKGSGLLGWGLGAVAVGVLVVAAIVWRSEAASEVEADTDPTAVPDPAGHEPDSTPQALGPESPPTLESPPATEAVVEPTRVQPVVARPPDEPSTQARPSSAAQMLVAADDARRERKNHRARARYLALIDAHPGSREALIGRISLGKLDLERLRRPRRALKHFDAYLRDRPDGNLAEEANYLRARCFEELGEPDEEREALRELLRRFPAAVHASRARTRLVELGSP